MYCDQKYFFFPTLNNLLMVIFLKGNVCYAVCDSNVSQNGRHCTIALPT